MKRFNKNAALNKLDNKNNSKTKKKTIVISIIVLFFAILYFSFARFESNESFSLISGTVQPGVRTIIATMQGLKLNGSTDLEYDGTDTLGANGTTDNNLRYIGANPNNYIYYNCDTSNPNDMNDYSCEKWRIIGIFNNTEDDNGENKSLVKIIRGENLGRYSYDTSDSSINNGYGINQWGESTYKDGTIYEGSDLMRELNTDYLGNITIGTDGKWYYSSNNKKTATIPLKLLNDYSQNMIQSVVWHTGANSSSTKSDWTTKNLYNWERGTYNSSRCTDKSYCNDTVVRTSSWTGKVALMYPSDCGYSTSGGETTDRQTCLNTSIASWNGSDISDCKNNSWLYDSGYPVRTITPNIYYSTNNDYSYAFSYYGYLQTNYAANGNYVYPTIYLKPNILIVSGDGSESNPYKLSDPSADPYNEQIETRIIDKLNYLASINYEYLAYDGMDSLGEYGTLDNNLRYVSLSPSNTIYFNCSTTDPFEMNDETCEKWKIVGLFNNIQKADGTTESLVKIQRSASIGSYSWDTSDSSINYGYGINQWGPSGTYEGSDIMRELNNDYFGNAIVGTDGYWYNGSNNAKTGEVPSSILNQNAQSMVETVVWNIGTPNNNGTIIETSEMTPSLLYSGERTSYNGKNCSSSNTFCNDTVTRTTSWIGKVALPYASDFGYAVRGGSSNDRTSCVSMSVYDWYNYDNCYTTNWMYTTKTYWTLDPFASTAADYGVCVNFAGNIIQKSDFTAAEIYPNVYLKSNIGIISGTGNWSDPYKLVVME